MIGCRLSCSPASATPLVLDRLYSEAEVQALLRQAAERQQRLGPVSDAHGLTLAEIEAIAAEAGLDPAHVCAAAHSGPEQDEARHVLGAPWRVRRSRLVNGPLTDAAWIAAVQDLRSTLETDGTATQLGPVREWKAGKRDERIRVTAEPEGDGYRLTLEQDYTKALNGFLGGAIGMAIMPVFLAAMMLATGNTDPWPALVLTGLMATGFVVGPAIGYRQKSQAQGERFDAVLDRAERGSLQANAERLAAPRASLHLDARVDAPVSEPAPVRRRDRV